MGLTSCLCVLSLFVQDTLGVLGVGEEFGFSVLVGTVAFAVCNFVFREELGFSSLLGGFFGDGCFNQVRSSHSLQFLLRSLVQRTSVAEDLDEPFLYALFGHHAAARRPWLPLDGLR